MGLDVIFLHGDKEISWNDPIAQKQNGFPFELRVQIIDAVYDNNDEIIEPEKTHSYIAEICGMMCIPGCGIFFQAKEYSWFANEEELPYSFHHSFSPDELKEQATALLNWLETHHQEPDTIRYSGQSIGSIRHLSALLNWAVIHNLGTEANS